MRPMVISQNWFSDSMRTGVMRLKHRPDNRWGLVPFLIPAKPWFIRNDGTM